MAQPTDVAPAAPEAASGFDFLISPQASPMVLPAASSGDLGRRPRGARRRRPSIDARSAAIPIALALGAVLLLGGAAVTGFALVQASEEQVKADSAAMCTDFAQTPGVLAQPGFGWPTNGADLQSTVASMKEYRDRWLALAGHAAPTIRPDVAAVAAAASSIIEGIEISESIDRAGSLAQMQAVTSSTAIPAWAEKYCD